LGTRNGNMQESITDPVHVLCIRSITFQIFLLCVLCASVPGHPQIVSVGIQIFVTMFIIKSSFRFLKVYVLLIPKTCAAYLARSAERGADVLASSPVLENLARVCRRAVLDTAVAPVLDWRGLGAAVLDPPEDRDVLVDRLEQGRSRGGGLLQVAVAGELAGAQDRHLAGGQALLEVAHGRGRGLPVDGARGAAVPFGGRGLARAGVVASRGEGAGADAGAGGLVEHGSCWGDQEGEKGGGKVHRGRGGVATWKTGEKER